MSQQFVPSCCWVVFQCLNGLPLFIHSSIDGYFDYFQTQLSYIFAYRFLCGHAFVSLGVGLLIHKISVCLTSKEIAKLFSKGLTHSVFPPAMYESSRDPTSSSACGIVGWNVFTVLPYSCPSLLVNRLRLLQLNARLEVVEGWALCWSLLSASAHRPDCLLSVGGVL